MHCPHCSIDLEKNNYDGKIISFLCHNCGGQAVTIGGLRTLGIEPENAFLIWNAAQKAKLGAALPCPECGNRMNIVKVDTGNSIFYIDVCIRCHTIWFDTGELENLPIPRQMLESLPPQAKEIIAVHKIKNLDSELSNNEGVFNKLSFFGIDRQWCTLILRLALKLIFKI